METGIFAGGCFWCTEAVLQRINGVEDVVPGFTAGHVKNPAYREVVTGRTGHAEAIRFQYDPSIVSYADLVTVFLATHDPTSLNRQGADVGTQYRSGIYYTTDEQCQTARGIIEELNEKNVFGKPIVTEVQEAGPFYVAEEDHHDYYNQNPYMGYCNYVIDPKVNKLREHFAHLLKPAA